jgi:hypothetical protein
MSHKLPIYNVTIDGLGVTLERLKPGHGRWRKARKKAVLRQRDAIERFQALKKSGRFDGVHSFQFLDSARTFALLRLGLLESRLQDSLDQVLAYDGSKKSSAR